MICSACNREVPDHVFFCPVCGRSFELEAFSKSAFCWGGNGTRYHRYHYPNMNVVSVEAQQLPHNASYPVHWHQWLFYTSANRLTVCRAEEMWSLDLTDERELAYVPAIIPPWLFLIPCAAAGNILKINILSLIDAVLEDKLNRSMVCGCEVSVRSNVDLPPAVWFKPGEAQAGRLMAFWEGNSLKCWDVTTMTVKELYVFHGLLGSVSYAPCFDAEGNVWLADNANQCLIKFERACEFAAVKTEYKGVLSAPIFADEGVHFYLTRDNLTELIRHPGRPILQLPRVAPDQFPQHLGLRISDHPGYLVSAKLTGATLSASTDQDFRPLIHPVWIQRNQFNAMILVYK